jgi:hypothetical protein
MVSKGRLGSEFSQTTIDKLRDDVGNRCALCDCPTSGPSREPGKRTNVGSAAHITAAAPGGPRYDATLSPAQRRSHENGIWCCRNCGKKVDDDTSTYTVSELQDKKRKAIDLAHERVTNGRVTPKLTFDVAALRTRWDSELAAMEKLYDEVGNMADKISGDVWRTYHYAAKVWDGWDTPIWTSYKRQLGKVYGNRKWWTETAILYKRWNEARAAFRGRERPDLVTVHAAFAKRNKALDAINNVRRCLRIEAELETISERDRTDAIRVCEAGAKATSGTFHTFAESLGIKPDGLAVRLATAAWNFCCDAQPAEQETKAAHLLRTGWIPTVEVMMIGGGGPPE